jgi:hypothetical protein
MSDSAAAMKDKLPVTFGLFITVTFGLVLTLVVTLGLGMLLAMPFMMVFLAALYAKATGQKTAY